MQCTALIICQYSCIRKRTVNVANFIAEDVDAAVKKAVAIVNDYDRRVLALLINGKNEVLSIDETHRVTTRELLTMAS